MASLRFAALLLGISMMFLLISPSHSQTCKSQNFTNNKLYTNCTDLPTLSAYLHWTYDAAKSSLSIAFLAPPAKSDGWIAWAINPTGTRMVGSQALIAFKQSNGSMTVNTYNISSYSSILPSNLSFTVSNKTAENSGGLMKIFATLELPGDSTKVNQVWQVGGSVTDGRPDKHEFQQANLNSMETLDLITAAVTISTPPASAPGPGPSAGTAPPSAGTNTSATAPPPSAATSWIRNSNFGLNLLLFVGSFVLCF